MNEEVRIEEDEWYPVYSLSKTEYGYRGELTTDELRRVRACFAEFADVQQLLREGICRAAGHKRHDSDRKWIDGQGTVRGRFAWCNVCGVDMDATPDPPGDEGVRPTA